MKNIEEAIKNADKRIMPFIQQAFEDMQKMYAWRGIDMSKIRASQIIARASFLASLNR